MLSADMRILHKSLGVRVAHYLSQCLNIHPALDRPGRICMTQGMETTARHKARFLKCPLHPHVKPASVFLPVFAGKYVRADEVLLSLLAQKALGHAVKRYSPLLVVLGGPVLFGRNVKLFRSPACGRRVLQVPS